MNKDVMKKRRGCNLKKEPIRTSRNQKYSHINRKLKTWNKMSGQTQVK